jgi:hypothetical protein
MDSIDYLRHIAGRLINGDIRDGQISASELCSAADELERLRACAQEAQRERVSADDLGHTIYAMSILAEHHSNRVAARLLNQYDVFKKGISASPQKGPRPDILRIEHRLELRLHDHLCEMVPNQEDSIAGFNEAWNVVRAVMKDELERAEI